MTRTSTLSLLILLNIVGCAGAIPNERAAQPEPFSSQAVDTPSEPDSSMAVDSYTTKPGAPTGSRFHAELVADGMLEQIHRQHLSYDLRLERTATILVDVLERGYELDSVTIRQALWLNGVPETSATTASLTAPSRHSVFTKLSVWLEEKSDAGCTRLGLALRPIPGGWQAVAIALPSLVEFESFPRTLPGPGEVELQFEVAEGYSKASVVMTSPDGRTIERSVPGDASRGISLELNLAGVWQLEVVALSESGPSPLAIFPVAVGVPHEVRLGGARYNLEERAAAELERDLFRYLSEERGRQGLGSLELDERLSDVAREYSAEMAETGAVAHISPVSGDVADRVNRAEMHYPSLAENLGRGMSPHEVHLGLMSSPAHRGAILEPTAYKVGIGVALDRNDVSTSMLVTQIFALRAEEVDTDATKQEILAAIGRVRRAAGMKKLPALASLERDAVRRESLCFEDDFDMELDWDGSLFKSVVSMIWKWPGGRRVTEEDVLPFLDPGFAAVGVHVTQGNDPEMGEGTVCAVVLVGVTE